MAVIVANSSILDVCEYSGEEVEAKALQPRVGEWPRHNLLVFKFMSLTAGH